MFSSQRGRSWVWGLLGAASAIVFMVGGTAALVSTYEGGQGLGKRAGGQVCRIECRQATPAQG